MPISSMLQLALNLQSSLLLYLPPLLEEVDLQFPLHAPTPVPDPSTGYILGVRVEMIKRDLDSLPVVACGIYMREQDFEGEQEFSSVFMPFIVEAYLGETDPDKLYIYATKYALAIDLFVERYGRGVLYGYNCDEAPDIDISYVLGPERGGVYHQLVAATGIFSAEE